MHAWMRFTRVEGKKDKILRNRHQTFLMAGTIWWNWISKQFHRNFSIHPSPEWNGRACNSFHYLDLLATNANITTLFTFFHDVPLCISNKVLTVPPTTEFKCIQALHIQPMFRNLHSTYIFNSQYAHIICVCASFSKTFIMVVMSSPILTW